MNKKITLIVVLVVIVVVGVFAYIMYPPNNASVVIPTGAQSPKDATYMIDGQSVTLKNGVSSVPAAPGSAEQVTTQYFGNDSVGDLNGDGLPDTAFILTQNSGGSGTFYYVVVALGGAQGYTGTNGVLLGDRIAPQTTEIKNAQVIVNYVDRKAGDAMTVAPSVGVSKYLSVKGGQLVEVTNPTNTSVTYNNTDYGFTFSLPADWQGYSVVKSTWQGTALTNTVAPSGPKLLIRNPHWTATVHYEDIPILVFTIAQWNAYLAENFSVSAAPIQASELSRNNTYVFALPPRWDFDYSLGYAEADTIIAGNPLHAFNL
jgi:hypothetical protein